MLAAAAADVFVMACCGISGYISSSRGSRATSSSNSFVKPLRPGASEVESICPSPPDERPDDKPLAEDELDEEPDDEDPLPDDAFVELSEPASPDVPKAVAPNAPAASMSSGSKLADAWASCSTFEMSCAW